MRELLEYARSRLAQMRVAALWLLVLGACSAAGASTPTVWVAFASAVLVLQFRLWDDLEDIRYDRIRHPQRTLPRSARLARFRILWAASILAALAAFAMFAGSARVLGYAVLVFVFVLLYRLLRAFDLGRFSRSMLVLAKYPAFVSLLAPEPWRLRTAAAAMTLYLALAVHEWRGDPQLIAADGAPRVIAGICGICAALWIGQVWL